MTTSAMALNNEEGTLSWRLVMGAIALLGIVVVGMALLILNEWIGLFFLAISFSLFFRFIFKRYEARNLWILGTISLFTAIIAGRLTYTLFSNETIVVQPPLTPDEILQNAMVVGLTAVLVGVIVPFLLLVAIATAGILKWPKNEKEISFLAAFRHLLYDVLGIFYLSVIVDEKEIKGKGQDITRLENFGGPGRLTVFPGQVVVLHKRGRITRAVGLGPTMLNREEQIKTILPLGGDGNVNDIENVLTRDRIPLTFKVLHVVQMEPAADTEKRLEEGGLKIDRNDKKIGDDNDQCYESIAGLVALKAPDVWKSMKGAVEGKLKDVIMSCEFDELFSIGECENLADCINNRKISEIEEIIKEAVKESGPGKGVVLRAVDISEVQFPEEISEKLNKQVTALLDARIQQMTAKVKAEAAQSIARAKVIEARARNIEIVSTAKSKSAAAAHQANANLKLAKAEAQANALKEDVKIQARTASFKQIIQILKDTGQPDETVKEILQSIAASNTLEDELKRLLELTVHYIHGEHTGKPLPPTVSEHDQDGR